MSQLFKASLLLTIFFGLNKLVALLRQVVIARQFGLSPEIDAFNVANNFPDLIVSLISGGALAFAFIPILSQYKQNFGLNESWKLFSHIANMVFIATAVLSLIIAIFARPVVSASWGIAPGFSPEQQDLVVSFMRLNLLATLIFSVSGLLMASLHANKHFLLPAIAPILYNAGQIFGAFILAPSSGLHIGPLTIPTFNMGIYGLVYGVILGSLLHLVIQIPGAMHYKFRWSPVMNFKDEYVLKVLELMGPRILTVLLIHFIFIARDNLASRMPTGTVSALTYGYFIMQVPETLLGTAIGTALLPTLSELKAGEKRDEFAKTLNRTIRVMIAATVIFVVLPWIGIGPLIETFFKFTKEQTVLMVWTTRAYLLGLLGHSLLEIVSRAYYARHNAKLPLVATFLRAVLFIILAFVFFNSHGAIGLALADSISVTVELVLLLVLLVPHMPDLLKIWDTLIRVMAGCAVSAVIMISVLNYVPLPAVSLVFIGGTVAGLVYLVFIWKELRILIRL